MQSEFEMLVDLHDSIFLAGEFTPNRYIKEFIEQNDAFKRVSDYLFTQQDKDKNNSA